jgi:hypothetical protein
MSRFEKYRKLREGTLDNDTSDGQDLEADKINQPKKVREQLKITLDKPREPSPEIAPETPKEEGSPSLKKEKPVDSPLDKPKEKDSPGLFQALMPAFSFLFFVGFIMTLALGFGYGLFKLFEQGESTMQTLKEERRSSASEPKRDTVKRQILPREQARHKTLDFFITDAGEVVGEDKVKNLKNIGTVIGTDPVFNHKVRRRNERNITVEVYGAPDEADYTYLLLEGGDRLPVDIAMNWLKQPVVLYSATNRYSGQNMVCLARPINRCAYLHNFTQR